MEGSEEEEKQAQRLVNQGPPPAWSYVKRKFETWAYVHMLPLECKYRFYCCMALDCGRVVSCMKYLQTHIQQDHRTSVSDIMDVGRHSLSKYHAVPKGLIPNSFDELPEREFFTSGILWDLPITDSSEDIQV